MRTICDINALSGRKEQPADAFNPNRTRAVSLDVTQVVDLLSIPESQHSETIIARDVNDAAVREVPVSELGDHGNSTVAGICDTTTIDGCSTFAAHQHR